MHKGVIIRGIQEGSRPGHRMKLGGCVWTGRGSAECGFRKGTRSQRDPIPHLRSFVLLNDRLRKEGVNPLDGIEGHVPNEINAENHMEWISILKDAGMVLSMITPNLFWEFPDCALSSSNASVRNRAFEYATLAIDLAYKFEKELGHLPKLIFWPGSEGFDRAFEKNHIEALKWFAHSLNQLLDYDQHNYGGRLLFAIEPKPNEPRGKIYIPTAGDALAIATAAKYPERVGVNIETAHEMLANLDPRSPVIMALALNKLFHYHANWQEGVKFDEDLEVKVNLTMLEILHMIREGAPDIFIGLDMQPRPTDHDRLQCVEVSIRNIRLMEEVLDKVDWGKVQELRNAREFMTLEYEMGLLLSGKQSMLEKK